MYLLLSSEYPRNNEGVGYNFLDINTGKILKFNDKREFLPSMYTSYTIQDLLLLPEMNDEGYIRSGKFNDTRIHSVETVYMTNIYNRRKEPFTKIVFTPTYIQRVKAGKFEGLYKLLPKSKVYDSGKSTIDQFTAESGLTMGMLYDITMEGFIPILPEELPDHESFHKYPSEIVDWAKPKLFAKIPKLAQYVLAIDIEVDIPQRRQPDVFNVEFPISSIAFATTDDLFVYVLSDRYRGTKEVKNRYDSKYKNIIIYESEKDMIVDAIEHIIKSVKAFLSGYNIDEFDLPYLLTRAELYGLVYDEIWGRTERVFNTMKQIHETRVIKGIKGKFIIDLYPFMSNPSIKNYAFGGLYERNTLDDVASGLLNKNKIEHELWFNEMSSHELAYYNMVDTELIIDLLEYNNEIIVQLMITLMRLGGLTIESVCRRMISATLKGYFSSLMQEMNFMTPNRRQLHSVGEIESVSTTGKGFKGALVIDPRPEEEGGKGTRGVHFDVIAVDYQSLYPSIIESKNISFETMNCHHTECKDNVVPELTHHVCTRNRGFLSMALGFIRDARVYYFKPERKNNPEFDVIEQTLKVLINAGYGVVSSSTFYLYCPPVGETVTAYGRDSISQVFDKAEEDGNEVLYADTDSAFISSEMDYVKYLMDWTRENIGLELGIDYIADFMGLYRSKNYFMKIGERFLVKGMVGKKKNTPPIIQEAFQNVLEVTKNMNVDNYFDIRNKIIDIIRKYINYIEHDEELPVHMFKVSQAMKQEIKDYIVPTLASRTAHMIAIDMNSELSRKIDVNRLVPAGSVMDYVYVDPFFAKDHGTTTILPVEKAQSHMIDRNKYKNKLLSTLLQVTAIFNITDDELKGQQQLDSWF